MTELIKKTIASTNINFLIGAGLSSPFLRALANIEEKLTKTSDEKEISDIKKEYFEESISGNLELLNNPSGNAAEILIQYEIFYKNINQIILKRESSLLSKQVNVFTTNIDIFSEVALENTGIEFNDGFHGRFNPVFDIGNFKKSFHKTSLHYEKTSEIPVFNLLKLHGSVSWKNNEEGTVLLDKELSTIKKINDDFKCFDELMIVNPTEKKFHDTILNQTYYDLLRIFSNELEKENTVLFVAGFSFADKHIRDITLRAANSNPTLKILILSYDDNITTEYNELFEGKNKNVEIMLSNKDTIYDLKGINELFSRIFNAASKEDDVTGD